MKKIITERGQSLVELSISLVVLLMLLAGAVEFGMAFFQFVQLRDAAQEGALYGSMNPDDTTGIIERVRESSSSPIDLSTFPNACTGSNNEICITYSGSDHCEGEGITVTLIYNHEVFMPFVSEITKEIPLTATVTDTILSPVCP